MLGGGRSKTARGAYFAAPEKWSMKTDTCRKLLFLRWGTWRAQYGSVKVRSIFPSRSNHPSTRLQSLVAKFLHGVGALSMQNG